MFSYSKLARKLFSKQAKSIIPYSASVKKDMKASNLNYTMEEYISMALLTVVLAFFLETVAFSVVFSLVLNNVLLGIFSAFFLSLLISAIITFVFYIYPSSRAESRKKGIERVLPFASTYLSVISSGGVSPSTMFRTLSQFDEYGEVSKDAKTITRDIEVFGMTAGSAVRKEASKTPSSEFKDLLYGMSSTIASGGNLTRYLQGKSDELMSIFRRKITKYSSTLSLFIELYLTLLIAGSVFFIVLSSIMSVVTGGTSMVFLQSFVVFILLPLISLGFIILIKSVSPTG